MASVNSYDCPEELSSTVFAANKYSKMEFVVIDLGNDSSQFTICTKVWDSDYYDLEIRLKGPSRPLWDLSVTVDGNLVLFMPRPSIADPGHPLCGEDYCFPMRRIYFPNGNHIISTSYRIDNIDEVLPNYLYPFDRYSASIPTFVIDDNYLLTIQVYKEGYDLDYSKDQVALVDSESQEFAVYPNIIEDNQVVVFGAVGIQNNKLVGITSNHKFENMRVNTDLTFGRNFFPAQFFFLILLIYFSLITYYYLFHKKITGFVNRLAKIYLITALPAIFIEFSVAAIVPPFRPPIFTLLDLIISIPLLSVIILTIFENFEQWRNKPFNYIKIIIDKIEQRPGRVSKRDKMALNWRLSLIYILPIVMIILIAITSYFNFINQGVSFSSYSATILTIIAMIWLWLLTSHSQEESNKAQIKREYQIRLVEIYNPILGEIQEVIESLNAFEKNIKFKSIKKIRGKTPWFMIGLSRSEIIAKLNMLLSLLQDYNRFRDDGLIKCKELFYQNLEKYKGTTHRGVHALPEAEAFYKNILLSKEDEFINLATTNWVEYSEKNQINFLAKNYYLKKDELLASFKKVFASGKQLETVKLLIVKQNEVCDFLYGLQKELSIIIKEPWEIK